MMRLDAHVCLCYFVFIFCGIHELVFFITFIRRMIQVLRTTQSGQAKTWNDLPKGT